MKTSNQCLASLFAAILVFLTWGLLAVFAVAKVPVVATGFAVGCMIVGCAGLGILFCNALR